jgi:cell division septation protein DedD
MKRVCSKLVLALLGAGAGTAWGGEVLSVENAYGPAAVERLGTRITLKSGDKLAERDLVSVGAGGGLSLTFASHGFVELGPNSEIAIEKLPFASYADDLQTIFSLTRGYLRVVWERPSQSGRWPLFVYFGGEHAALNPGEYFFDQQSGVARACVAAGRLSVLLKDGGELQDLRPSACYRFLAGLPPERAARDSSGWIAVRRGFNIDAPTSPEAMLAANDAGGDAPAPEPAAAAQTPSASVAAVAPTPAPPVKPVARAVPPAPSAPPSTAAASIPAAAAPAPVQALAPPSPPPGGSGAWGVNIASYPAQADAEQHARQLQAAGYAATVQQALVRSQTWFRVQLRGYASADAARAAAAELEARFSYRGLWVNKTGAAAAAAP